MIDKYGSTSINDIKEDASMEERRGYLKMLDFFVKNDFGVYTDNPSELPPLSMEYDSPYLATTVVVKSDSDNDYEALVEQMKEIGRELMLSVQINDEGHMTPEMMREIGELTIHSTIGCIHIYTHFSKEYKPKDFLFMMQNLRFRKIVFMGAAETKRVEPISESQGVVRYLKEEMDYEDCGNVGKRYFVIGQPFFIEGHSCNTCLNRKVSIDKEGNIGNCPLMPHTFGNIKTSSLREIVSRPDFQRLWHITKDEIVVCKDCEYRYICTDCRHYIKDKNNIYSQPSKCGYNPYIAKWSDEEGYVPVSSC